jgi:hypothetical protein
MVTHRHANNGSKRSDPRMKNAQGNRHPRRRSAGCPSQPTQASSMIQRHELAPDGDLTLVVGSQQREIRVYSVLLNNASPVLKEIFLSQVQRFANMPFGTHRTYLHFPRDDAEAFSSLCTLLHKPNDQASRPSPEGFLRLVELSTRYKCAGSISFALRYWIELLIPERVEGSPGNLPDLWAIMVAAHILDDHRSFSRITALLIQAKTESFLEMALQDRNRDLGLRLGCE